VARLLALLQALVVMISKRQIVRLLIAGQDGFVDEARDVLRAGLSSAKWITVDDTGARHKAKNGFCTQIGNAHFAWVGIYHDSYDGAPGDGSAWTEGDCGRRVVRGGSWTYHPQSLRSAVRIAITAVYRDLEPRSRARLAA